MMAKVGKCVSPLQRFKISAPILFFRRENESTFLLEIFIEYSSNREEKS